MRHISLSLVIIFLSAFTYAQELQKGADGLTYVDGKLYSGSHTAFNDDNVKTMEVEYKDGKIEGEYKSYYLDGSIQETGYYTQGNKDGNWEKFNEKGKTTGVANYKDGKKHDKWMIFDDNGTKRVEIFYNEGMKVNTWTMWDQDGNIISQKTYEAVEVERK